MNSYSRFMFLFAINSIVFFVLESYNASRGSSLLLPSTSDVILVTIIYVLLTVSGIVLMESYILGIVNSAMIVYTTNSFILEYYAVSLIASVIIAAKIQRYDALMSMTIKELRLNPDPGRVMHNLAAYFASLSLTLFIMGLFVREDIIASMWMFTLWIPLLITISMIPILVAWDPVPVVLAGMATAVGSLGLTPLAYLTIRMIGNTGSYISVGEREGVSLGLLKAVLRHGYPSKPYLSEGVERGRKQWYWERMGGVLRIDLNGLPNNHFVIVGASGMGKSRLAKNIVLQAYLKYKYNFTIIDPHGEYGDILEVFPSILLVDASNTTINPLELEGGNPGQRAHELSYTIQTLFKLGPLQRQVLEEVIIETYKAKGIYPDDPRTWVHKPPIFRDVLATAERLSVEDDVVKRVIPYLKILSTRVFSSSGLSMAEILSKPSIIQLNKLSSDYVRVIYMDTLLHKLLNTMYQEKERPLRLVVIDEAHHIFRRGGGRILASRLLMESRKYGMGFIIITQQPLALTDAVYQNTSVKIVFNTSEPRNLDYVSKLLAGLSSHSRINAVRKIVPSLRKYEFIASITNEKELFLAELIDYLEELKHVGDNKAKMPE